MSEQRDVLAVLDEYAAHEQRAYSHYKRQYAREIPPPSKPSRFTGIPWSAIPFAVIALAGSLLSALRTFPVFSEIARLTVGPEIAFVEGFLAMLAIDMAVVAFRFILVMLRYRGKETEAEITRWVRFGFWFAFTTQLVAQVYAVREIATVLNSASQAFELAIALAAALSGMILAFVTGEILAVLFLRSQGERKAAKTEYDMATADWRGSLKKSWDRNKSKFGVEPPIELTQNRLTLTNDASVSALTNTDTGTDNTANGGRRVLTRRKPPSPTERTVIRYLRENPDDKTLTVRELADKIGVNRDAVSKAKRRVSMNGHSTDNH